MKNLFLRLYGLLIITAGFAIWPLTNSIAQVSGSVSSGETYYKDKQVFRLKAWTIMSKIQWKDVIYRFPEFQEGRITLREGFSPDHPLQMNLNVLLGRIDYITNKGDTVAFESSQALKSVAIANHLFYNDYPNEGFVERVTQAGVSLGIKRVIKVMMESGTGERFMATDWNAPTSRHDRLYVKDDLYFFMDQNEKIYSATQPSILKLFHESKKEIKKFIKTEKINFKLKEDLITLLDYCNGKS